MEIISFPFKFLKNSKTFRQIEADEGFHFLYAHFFFTFLVLLRAYRYVNLDLNRSRKIF